MSAAAMAEWRTGDGKEHQHPDFVSPLELKLQQVLFQLQIRSSNPSTSAPTSQELPVLNYQQQHQQRQQQQLEEPQQQQQQDHQMLPSPVPTATTPSSSSDGEDTWGMVVDQQQPRQHAFNLMDDEDANATLAFIDRMLMEDQIDRQACLDLEVGVGVFQAELAELIQSTPSPSSTSPAAGSPVGVPSLVASSSSSSMVASSSGAGRSHGNDSRSSGARSKGMDMGGRPSIVVSNGGSPLPSPSGSLESNSPETPASLRKNSLKKRSHKETTSCLQQFIMKTGFSERESMFTLDWKNTRPPKQQQQQLQQMQQQQPPRPRMLFSSSRNGLRLTPVWEKLGLECGSNHLLEKLLACADAVSSGDLTTAWEYVGEIREQARPEGNATQRVVFYFVEALIAKMSNAGATMFSALCKARPSTGETVRAVQMIIKMTPFLSLPYEFSNKIILEAIQGHSKVHILDFGIMYGFQWPQLFQDLAGRPEGPPCLRITGIDLPPPGFKPSGRIRETGRRLRECAQRWGIPFKFRSHSSKWETVEPGELQLKNDEVLIVACMFKQTNLFDESVIAESPKNLWLNRIRNLNPKVFIQCLATSGFSPPFFVTRFEEALKHHMAIFAAMDNCISRMLPERRVIEQDKYGREIMNIIACDGFERVERSETHQQWQRRAYKAGLELIPISPSLFESCKGFARKYNKDLTVDREGEWIGLGWKNQIIHAYSAWRSSTSG